MRKFNSILTAVIMTLFLIHAFLGALNMLDVVVVITKPLARVMECLIGVHIVLSCILTVRSIKTWKRTGAPYLRENALFWARRLSGVAVMILLLFHVTAFGSNSGNSYALRYFGGFRLAANILMVISVVLHIIMNAKPMLISLGVRRLKPRVGDIAFFLSILMILFIIAFVVYYFRWNSI